MANKSITIEITDKTKEINELIHNEDKERQLRQQVTKMVSMANKRLKRLENNDLTDLPAYQQFLTYNEPKFSISGKSREEVVTEYWRLKHFIDSTTSTVRGANKVIQDVAETTGLKYTNLKDLKSKLSNFFRLADKVKEYLKSTGNTADALDYQKIWTQINTYVDMANADITSTEGMENTLDNIISQWEKIEQQNEKLWNELNPLFEYKVSIK